MTDHDQRDATEILIEDHLRVELLFARYEQLPATATTDERRDIVRELVRELSIHAVIEEQVLYPAVRKALPEGERLHEEALQEHAAVKNVLAELDKMEPTADDYETRVRELIIGVRQHVQEEEGEVFPKLREELGMAQLREMGKALERAKDMAPTRPHPHAPSTPPANTIVGTAAAVVDRVRDVVRDEREHPSRDLVE